MNNFIELYMDSWDARVSSIAIDSLETTKHNTVKLLPLVKDVAVLSKHIENEIFKAKTQQPCKTPNCAEVT
ncbi:hypothetical protein DPMN_187147 [Dreissena polymorpha]|uniref:Uncharacterized protein n=1 Tax=Dreissena polymorpha TaxID=45954 RepID=A0A9D4DNI3_DREPO|nr:hypothetical protein DPMN_187147 [Dreissena polymorpha]